jgi:hypothetical protein
MTKKFSLREYEPAQEIALSHAIQMENIFIAAADGLINALKDPNLPPDHRKFMLDDMLVVIPKLEEIANG